MSDAQPTPAEFVRAAVPGLFEGKTLFLAGAAAAAALVIGYLAVTLNLSSTNRAMLGGAGLLVWGQGAILLVGGEVRALHAGLAELAGVQWGIFLTAWWGPFWAIWILLS